MTAKYLVFIAACLVLACTQVSGQGLQVIDGKNKITIVKTSGCLFESAQFIRDQLAETYRLYGDFPNIEFIPWGRSWWVSDDFLWCQFGEADCRANRLHRCVLNMLEDNQAAQVHYMTCEFSSPYPSFLQRSYQCVEAAGVNLTDVDHCVAIEGDDLDKHAQAAADRVVSVINYIPTIVFNDVIDISLHFEALIGLKNMIGLALAEDPSTGVTNC